MNELRKAQRDELTDHIIYSRLSRLVDEENASVLKKMAEDELRHYETLKSITGDDVKPHMFRVLIVTLLARLLGVTFVVKFLENSERDAQELYRSLLPTYPQLKDLLEDEEEHEKQLQNLLQDDFMSHLGSIVLGFNDALVEMTGALVGLTFALENNKLIALSALVVGVSAALSMAASEYLSRRAEGHKDASEHAIYTGMTYILVVTVLVLPYFLFNTPLHSLFLTLLFSVLLVAFTSYYVSIVRDRSYIDELRTMLLFSLGIAFVSFLVGTMLRNVLGVDV